MNIRKFLGSNSRAALQAIKREFGPDAVILSNRSVSGGVEITAMPPGQLMAMPAERATTADPPSAVSQAPSPRTQPAQPSRSAPFQAPQTAQSVKPAEREAAFKEPVRTRPQPTPGRDWAEGMVSEIKALRGALETQLGTLVWGELQRREPVQAQMLRELLHAGFSPGLARFISENLPQGSDAAQGRRWMQATLARNLLCVDEDALLAKGGVYALIGPTGVGKTTTTAKLAARAVVRYGVERVALLTTDSYRIGAHEQLRIYGKILGVPVHAARDADDLRELLADLDGRHMVLIDTVGMSQRDKAVAEQVGMLCGAGAGVQRLLLLSACASADTIDETVRVYRADAGLAGAILTKMDEAVSLGGVLDAIIRHRLQLHYVANGQRVPEDLHAPNSDFLAHRSLNQRSTASAFNLQDLDVPALIAGATAARNTTTGLAHA